MLSGLVANFDEYGPMHIVVSDIIEAGEKDEWWIVQCIKSDSAYSGRLESILTGKTMRIMFGVRGQLRRTLIEGSSMTGICAFSRISKYEISESELSLFGPTRVNIHTMAYTNSLLERKQYQPNLERWSQYLDE